MNETRLPQITISSVMEEQETTIQFDRIDEDAEVFTSDPTMVTRLNKMVEKYPEIYKCREGMTGVGVFYYFPKKLITFRAPASQAMIESGKRLAALRHGKDDGDEENA